MGVFFHLQVSFALTKCIFLDLQVPEHSRIQIQFKIYPTEYGTLLVLRWIIVLMSLFSNERMIPTSMQGSKTQFFDVKKGPSPPLTQMMLILYNNRTILKA